MNSAKVEGVASVPLASVTDYVGGFVWASKTKIGPVLLSVFFHHLQTLEPGARILAVNCLFHLSFIEMESRLPGV